MKVIISSKNFSASDHLKETIESKFEKLGKYFSNDIAANITLTAEKGRQKIEATINAKGTIFRAEEVTLEDMYTAVDRIVDKLSTQMSRFKTKLQRKHKDSKELLFEDLPEAAEPEPNEAQIVRRKSFDLMPMTPDEAVMQMELSEHNFYIFSNMDTESVAVVYKRKDGKYGLLEPNY
jgi:putative sigma-54 modulation protein